MKYFRTKLEKESMKWYSLTFSFSIFLVFFSFNKFTSGIDLQMNGLDLTNLNLAVTNFFSLPTTKSVANIFFFYLQNCFSR